MLYRFKRFVADVVLYLAGVLCRNFRVNAEKRQKRCQNRVPFIYFVGDFMSFFCQRNKPVVVNVNISAARLTLGFENPIYSATSGERTAPFRDNMRIVSRYISPDSCKCMIISFEECSMLLLYILSLFRKKIKRLRRFIMQNSFFTLFGKNAVAVSPFLNREF